VLALEAIDSGAQGGNNEGSSPRQDSGWLDGVKYDLLPLVASATLSHVVARRTV
jgi:hypothetical protein